MTGRILCSMAEGSVASCSGTTSMRSRSCSPTLRKEGYGRRFLARDGREALDRFAAERFDLVVLDIMLPKLDGIEVRRGRGAEARCRSSC